MVSIRTTLFLLPPPLQGITTPTVAPATADEKSDEFGLTAEDYELSDGDRGSVWVPSAPPLRGDIQHLVGPEPRLFYIHFCAKAPRKKELRC